jgi:outer membrane protein OmpA-like peptidoglycan-associated protein
MELLLAARARLPLGLEVTLGAGPGIGSGYGTPRFRVVASAAFAPPVAPPPPRAAAVPPPAPEPVALAAESVPVEPPPAPAAEPPPVEPPLAPAAEPPPEPVAPAPEPTPAPRVVVKKGRIVILQQVRFANDRDVILPDSFPLLEEVSQVLLANPRVARVRVEGHTDSKGKPVHNTRLSERRARKVREFLVERGVAAGRLEARGFGPERPLVPNTTPVGRARNRRVEFVILEETY